MNTAKRIDQSPELSEVNTSASPKAIADAMIVCLWVRREDIKPDPRSEIKYPNETQRKREPASAWLMSRSDSTPGINGARMMRAKKLTKKIDVSKNSGVNRSRMVSERPA